VKKLSIYLGIVIVLVIGTFGGVVMAKPEMQPVDAWNYIVEKLDEIAGVLGDLGGDVSAVDEKIDDLGNLVRMETDNWSIVLADPVAGYISEPAIKYDEIRHVVLTINMNGGLGGLQPGDDVNVIAYWPGYMMGAEVFYT
jgi:hypothetical protein